MPSEFAPQVDPVTGEIISPPPYDPSIKEDALAQEINPDDPPPPATSEAVGGQIDENNFLGVRTSGPYAGMLLANNVTDEGLAEAVLGGSLIPSAPPEQLFPEGPPQPERNPVIAGLTPDSAAYTVTELTLDIVGSDFAEGDTVFSDDLEATTVTFVSDSHITAYFETILVETPRDTEVRVETPDGTTSNYFTFSYQDEAPPDTVEGGA